jgi:hypothetical protein
MLPLHPFRILKVLVLWLITGAALAAEPNERFVAVGYGGRRIVSDDGKKWEIAAEWQENGGDDSNNLMSVVFAKEKFVAVGGGGGGKTGGGHVLVSRDGREWKEVFTLPNRIHPIVFGNDRFVAGGTNRKLLWSDDGETWHEGPQITLQEATHFRQGAFGNGVFVFIGNHGGNSTPYWCATSTDGEKIKSERRDLPAVRGLAFGAKRFVLVGEQGVLRSSADGDAWESHDVPAENDLTWIVWDGAQFLTGGSKLSFTSADGLKWEETQDRIPCHVLWSDGQRAIGTSWPGQMWHWQAGGKWQRSEKMTPNGINQAARGEVR